jgi:hypothetical protein
MCGEFKGRMTELMNQKELLGAIDMGMLWMISAMNLYGFKILKFVLGLKNDKCCASWRGEFL